MNTPFKVGDKVKAVAYKDCFGVDRAEVRGLVVVGVKHIPETHGVTAYDRLDCELENLGEALANRKTLPETIRVEAAARFFAHEHNDLPVPFMVRMHSIEQLAFLMDWFDPFARNRPCWQRYCVHCGVSIGEIPGGGGWRHRVEDGPDGYEYCGDEYGTEATPFPIGRPAIGGASC